MLHSMKMTAAERKQSEPVSLAGGEPDAPRYPYGLELMLDDAVLEKLELDDLPDVGAVMTLIARVEVRSTAVDEVDGQGKRRRMTLQVTDCCLEEGAPPATLADALYGKD